jgi:hypothetical protein
MEEFHKKVVDSINLITEAELTSETPLGRLKEAGEILGMDTKEIEEAQKNYLDSNRIESIARIGEILGLTEEDVAGVYKKHLEKNI